MGTKVGKQDTLSWVWEWRRTTADQRAALRRSYRTWRKWGHDRPAARQAVLYMTYGVGIAARTPYSAPTPTCGAEYGVDLRMGGRFLDPTCGLPDGHDGPHQDHRTLGDGSIFEWAK